MKRKFIGIHFKCCNIYGRIYKKAEKKVYEGRCPKCGSHVSVPIRKDGTNRRFFSTTQ